LGHHHTTEDLRPAPPLPGGFAATTRIAALPGAASHVPGVLDRRAPEGHGAEDLIEGLIEKGDAVVALPRQSAITRE
jgi:hypothetical protein